MEIGQDRALRLHPRDPGERHLDVHMRRMRAIAQCVEDPALDTFERRESLARLLGASRERGSRVHVAFGQR